MTQARSNLLKANVVVNADIRASNFTAIRNIAEAVHRLGGGTGGGE